MWLTRTVLHSLNARQSNNFIEFLRNASLQPPESILSSLRIAKRLGKRGWLRSWVVLLALAYRVKSPRVRHWKILSVEPVCVTGTVLHRLNALRWQFYRISTKCLVPTSWKYPIFVKNCQAIRKTRVPSQLSSFACSSILSEIAASSTLKNLEPVTHGHGFAASSTIRKISSGAYVTHGNGFTQPKCPAVWQFYRISTKCLVATSWKYPIFVKNCQAIRKTRVASQLSSFACSGILSEIAASSTLKNSKCGACVCHGYGFTRAKCRAVWNFYRISTKCLVATSWKYPIFVKNCQAIRKNEGGFAAE